MVPAFSLLGRDRLLLPLGLRGGKTGGADEEELEVGLKVAVVLKEEVDGRLVMVGGSPRCDTALPGERDPDCEGCHELS